MKVAQLFEQLTRYEKNEYKGKYTKLFFESENYCVGIFEFVKGEDEPENLQNYFIAVAHFEVECEVPLNIKGYWETSKKYDNRQFVIEYAEKVNVLNKEGLISFLKNHPELKGIGPVKAEEIANYCGDDFDDIISNKIDILAQHVKIKGSVLANLERVWKESKIYNKTILELSNFGFTFKQCVKIYKIFGSKCITEIKKNPYCLIDKIERLGFLTIDKIAMRMGVKPEHPQRIEAGVTYVLDEQMREGHTWGNLHFILREAETLLQINNQLIFDFVKSDAKQFFINIEQEKISLAWIYFYEKFISEYIISCEQQKVSTSKINTKYTQLLNQNQLDAIEFCLNKKFAVVTGKAGTGKTFIIKTLFNIYNDLDYDVALAAPTGRAAKRIEEVVGHNASTIHRLLGYDTVTFTYNKDEKLPHDVIIIDEFSMVDVWLGYHLFSAIPDDAILICVGDHNQLPPVGPGNILRDVINLSKQKIINCVVELTQVVRQAGHLKKNSISILEGILKDTSEDTNENNGRKEWYLLPFQNGCQAYDIQQYVVNIVKNIERIGFNPSKDVQIITPMKDGDIGVRELNLELQQMIQNNFYGVKTERPKTDRGRANFYKYDRVIQMVNNYQLGIMNGEIGEVVSTTDKQITIQFDSEKITYQKNDALLLDVELAYALTIHKTQGSEYPCVIIVLHSYNYRMLHRNLLYTAVTRAKKTAFLIGEQRALAKAVSHIEVDHRLTSIPQIIYDKLYGEV